MNNLPAGKACSQLQFKSAVARHVHVATHSVTVMCADAADDSWGAADTAIFAQRFGGRWKAGAKIAFILSFEKASSALRAAVAWQRIGTGGRPRVSLLTTEIPQIEPARPEANVTYGQATEQALQLALNAAGGTIAVSPETYLLVREQIVKEIRDALVMTEMDGGTTTHASILLAPAAASELSTFAGLGLT